MLKNLLQTGTVFDYSADDQSFVDDLLSADVGNIIQIHDGQAETSLDKSFEDED